MPDSQIQDIPEDQKVQTIQCKCGRLWPSVSEQGVVFDILGTDQCYQCFRQEVIRELQRRQASVSYQIHNCPDCMGQTGLREGCKTCGGLGWIAEHPDD